MIFKGVSYFMEDHKNEISDIGIILFCSSLGENPL